MSKKKIADSIIIKVGGGIREVSREPLRNTESIEPAPVHEAEGEQADDMHPLGGNPGAKTKIGVDEFIH